MKANPLNSLQYEKAEIFQQLHKRPGLFIIPNPWDAGSAKILTKLGFAALATTSAGLSFMIGKPDGEGAISADEAFANATSIVNATVLPVSGDLENGYGDDPESCAATVLRAAQIGLVGCSIEDATGKPADPIYEFELAVQRIQASVAAARSLSFPFQLTARAENYLHGRMDLADTIRRLEAFAEAGADVLYAPGLKKKEEVGAVVWAVAPKPVNVLMGLRDNPFTLNELAQLGVKRVSVGSALSRAAYGTLFQAANAIQEKQEFEFTGEMTPYEQLNDLLR